MFSKQRIFLAKAPHAALLRTQINPSTMAGPQMYEISSVSSTKGCSKQIHDLLTGGARLFLRWVRLNSVSLLILSGLHGYFGTFPRGIGYFHCFLALCSSACKKM